MASDPLPKLSDDEIEPETVKRRLIDMVRGRIDGSAEVAQGNDRGTTEATRPGRWLVRCYPKMVGGRSSK